MAVERQKGRRHAYVHHADRQDVDKLALARGVRTDFLLSDAAGADEGLVGAYEIGRNPLAPEALERLAPVAVIAEAFFLSPASFRLRLVC